MGDLYFPQPSGSCLEGSQYAEDLILVIRYDDGGWVPRGYFEPTLVIGVQYLGLRRS